jgi:UTP--glucose-1-phosphate uridylyltransferase
MIRKAVIPAAGYGTRFLPATKSLPKEMLPVVDRPVIQYVVEEAVASGIQDILIIVSRGKRAIEEHFDRHPELEDVLADKGRTAELESIRRIASLARIHFAWQKTLQGLGDAIACARDHVGHEPFAVLLGDTLVESTIPLTRQLMDIHSRYGGSVVALEQVPPAKVSRYGVIRGKTTGDRIYAIEDLVEKPSPELAPSNLAIAGRYLLVPEVFDILDRTEPGRNGEVQLTDALVELARAEALRGLVFEGRRHDLGDRLDWLQANVSLGLARQDIAPDFRRFLEDALDLGIHGQAGA